MVLAELERLDPSHLPPPKMDYIDWIDDASSNLDWGPAKNMRGQRLYDGVDKWGLEEKEERRKAAAGRS